MFQAWKAGYGRAEFTSLRLACEWVLQSEDFVLYVTGPRYHTPRNQAVVWMGPWDSDYWGSKND